MSRTSIYKGVYFGIVGIGTAALLGSIVFFRLSPVAIVIVFVLLLAPGRILGYFWRDLLRGLRRLNQREYAESRRHSALFVAEVRRRPWLKKLIWLGSASYSRDAESLALNNLGAAEIGLGEFASARAHLESSIEVDRQNPLPYFNIGVLLRIEGNSTEAERWIEQAAQLGFAHGISDSLVTAAQSRFANTDGRG